LFVFIGQSEDFIFVFHREFHHVCVVVFHRSYFHRQLTLF
jgi:hypothetical protein